MQDLFYNNMTFGMHLEELRKRILYCLMAFFGVTILTIIDQSFYMGLILLPHLNTMQELNQPATIQVLHYEESFFCHLKVSIIASLILTIPFIFYQMWLFISTGLYESEKRYFGVFFPFILLFFLTGILFGYFILIPLALKFLGGYGENIQIGFTLSSYLSLFFVLTFVSGIIFQLPLLMLFSIKIGILKSNYYLENWRYAVLIIFILAAVLTPPDVVTQLLLAIPMLFLYFCGIFLCRTSERIQEIQNFFYQK
ncbi:MAG: twin-arginine translocase subunit TatC [Candidatus Brocadiae bacterium]|nr:twin-arginine translocase subunit TatC [Candidatus Brocadiia bacterium]